MIFYCKLCSNVHSPQVCLFWSDYNYLSYSYSLGLDIPGLFGLTTTTIDSVLIPTRVKSVKSRINDIAMGPNHTVCLTDDGKVITMGHNNDAQLGRGHARSYTRLHSDAF